MSAAAPDTLRKWAAENPAAPPAWREIALRLANNDEMHSVWDRLGESAAMPLLRATCEAVHRASAEVSREPAADEKAKLNRVVAATKALREAIEAAPIPRDRNMWVELTGEEPHNAQLWVSWRESTSGMGFGYQITCLEMTELVQHLVEKHIESLPPRSVDRAREHPEILAVLRWLQLEYKPSKLTPTLLAHIVNAVLAPDPPLDAESVKAKLKKSPQEFERAFKTEKDAR